METKIIKIKCDKCNSLLNEKIEARTNEVVFCESCQHKAMSF